MEQQSENLFELQIDHQSNSFLRETAKWAKFLSIVGFVMIALFLLVLIFAGSMMSSAMESTYGTSNRGGAIQLYVLAPLILIYFFPTWYLFRFATKMQVALRNNDQETLNASFENLKSCFKFMGILMIIILSLYALIFVGALFVGGSMMR